MARQRSASRACGRLLINTLVQSFAAPAHRHWRWVLIGMLLMLHLAAINDVQQWWSRGFMVAHFGLFILWQPFLRSEQRLSGIHLLLIGCVFVVLMTMLNWCIFPQFLLTFSNPRRL